MPGRDIFISESYRLETAAWLFGGVVALGVAPAVVSSAVAAYIGTGSLFSIGAGVHASAQAFNFTYYYASPVIAAGSSRAVVALVRIIEARMIGSQLEGNIAPVSSQALVYSMDLAVPGFDALAQDRKNANIRRMLSV